MLLLTWLGVGLFLGGLTTALILWVVGGLTQPIPMPARASAVVAVALAVCAREFGLIRYPLVQNARQVPRDVFYLGPRKASIAFGFELGTGLRTRLTSALPYLPSVLLLSGALSLSRAVAVGLGFGAGRLLMPVLRQGSGTPTGWDDRVRDLSRWVRGLAALAASVPLLVVW